MLFFALTFKILYFFYLMSLSLISIGIVVNACGCEFKRAGARGEVVCKHILYQKFYMFTL